MNFNYVNPKQELGSMESTKEFIEFVNQQHQIYDRWNDKYSKLIEKHGITVKMIMQGCDVSESTAKRFKKRVPAKRHNVIQICAMMGLGVKKTNEILKNCSGFQRLYAKDPDDFVWLHILTTGKGNINPSPEEDFKTLKAAFEQVYQQYAKLAEYQGNDTREVEKIVLEKDGSFVEKAEKAVGMMYGRYEKLVNYIECKLLGCLDAKRVFEARQTFLNHYYQNMKKLKSHGFPDRNFLICLGINLSLSVDGINKLLDKAGMTRLCDYNIMESFLYYNLERIYAEYPHLFTDVPYDSHIRTQCDFLGNEYAEDCAEFIVSEMEKTEEFKDLSLQDKDKILKFLRYSEEE